MRGLTRRASLLVPWLINACASTDAGTSVEAWRYRELIVEGVEDMIHGGGQWHDMLYLPGPGVVALVVWPITWNLQDDPIMHARFEVPEDRLPEAVQTEIPRELAERIVELARRTTERDALGRQLARDAVASRAIGGRDTVKHRDDEPPHPARR